MTSLLAQIDFRAEMERHYETSRHDQQPSFSSVIGIHLLSF